MNVMPTGGDGDRRRPSEVDWSIADDPVFDQPEPAPPGPLRVPARRISWVRGSLAVTTLIAILGVGLGLALERWWQQRRLIDAVQAVVTAEDQARMAGDLEYLETLWAAYAPQVRNVRLFIAGRDRRVTLIRPDLVALSEPGRVVAIESLGADHLRVSVARRFSARDPAQASGVLVWIETQFYRLVEGHWRQVEPEREALNAELRWRGAWTDWEYSPLDEAYVAEHAPIIEAQIAAVCADVACPADTHLRIAVTVAGAERVRGSAPAVALADLLRSDNIGPGYVRLTSPARRGLPGDWVTRDIEQRDLSLRALAALMQRVAPGDTFNSDRRADWAARWLHLTRPSLP